MTEYQLSSFARIHKLLNLSDGTDIRELSQYFGLFDTNNPNTSNRHGTRIANALFKSGIKTVGDFRKSDNSKIAVTRFDGKLQKMTVAARLYFPKFLSINTSECEEKKNGYLLNDYDDVEILEYIFPCMVTIINKLKFKLNIQNIGQFLCIRKEQLNSFSQEDIYTILGIQEKIDVR